jgi:transposase-like protein
MPKRKITKTSEEDRNKICFDYFAKGHRIIDITRNHGIASSTINDIVDRFRLEGRVAYKPTQNAKNVKIKNRHSDYFRNLIKNEKDRQNLTINKLKDGLRKNFPQDFPNENSISTATIRQHIGKLNLNLKRSRAIDKQPKKGGMN